ncbi:hypothetical protein K402DRAFT_212562 [Aulographum hederae CBS 113979]|uniref:Protein-lysine N-methyltransferase EFM5 n=1 Tax=Aulographum hederae CBS 113979 TaxID=1176131 RepID=A0A6G1GMN4_9PEZI|nr:hypothetical protein K402DRAFT_212562 [Aulographum hederae CBS 113979]
MAPADDSDDDMPQLSADTLSILKQFQDEKDTRQKQFEDLKSQAEKDFDGGNTKLSMDAFTEDWQASQFWYSDETATTLAEQLLDGATDDSAIAVVSAPSCFIQLKNLLASDRYSIKPRLLLLEFDERFGVFKEFHFYNFEKPTQLPPELKGQFDRIICDPPFLSEDCQTKAALTVRWLSKNWSSIEESPSSPLRLLVCTGERMEQLISRLYGKAGIRTTSFEIQHSKGLSNEFRCYANFESDIWI